MSDPILTQPRCAVCEQPVKTVVWDAGGALEAYCHGEKDRAQVEPGQDWPAQMFAAREPEEDCAA
jgi:hypothetical protein